MQILNIKYQNYNSKFKISVFLFFIFYFLFFTSTVLAVDYLPLVPCGTSATSPCTRCDLFKLSHNVISFILFGLVPPIAAVLFIFAGLMILLGGAMPARIALGKTIFKNTFIGLLIILASYMIVNTFIQSFGPDQVKGNWFSFTCSNAGITAPGGAGGPLPSALCSDPAALASQNNVPYPSSYPNPPGVNAPELNQLISCIRTNMPGQNLGEISTFQKTGNTVCNFTRGKRTCGACIHEINSCHYGGASSRQGALAVDFGNEDIGDMIIGVAVGQCGAKNGRCEDSNGNTIGCTNSRANHVHINSRSCDRN